MAPPFWLWIPLTVWGAFAQTLRNAAQRSLVAKAGTLGATLVRFLYGFPFAAAYCWSLAAFTNTPIPDITPGFIAWVLFGGICQIKIGRAHV